MPDTAASLLEPRPEAESPLETRTETPTVQGPIEPATVFLGGLFALAVLAASYVTAQIVLPIVLAFVLSAVFRPVLRFFARFGVPRVVAALAVVLSLVAAFAFLALLLSAPVAEWISQLPRTLPQLQSRLKFLSGPIQSAQNALEHIEHLAPGGNGQPQVAVQNSNLPQEVLRQLRMMAEGAFSTIILLFFVLMFGDEFLRRLVEILPDFKSKRQAVDISQQIEQDISVYLATITMMNALVGIATGVMVWACGFGSPLLWGTVAFLLNYVPILGPTAGVLMLLVTGLVTIDPLWAAFVPAALYLLIHIAEGETVTPMLLASRFTVNPVLVMIGVIFWSWMWGVVGAVLSTPMLAIAKIICDRIDRLKPVGHFIAR